MPEEVTELKLYCEILPNHPPSASYPFAGYTINVNVCTVAHLDRLDRRLCFSTPVHDGEGGELFLYELGLIFKMRTLDFLVWDSARITHFNALYAGERLSIIGNTCSASQAWIRDFNGFKSIINHHEKKSADDPASDHH